MLIAFVLKVFFCFTILAMPLSQEKIIYIIPPCGYHNEKLFDMDDLVFNRDECMRPFYQLRVALRKLGYDLKTTTFEKIPKRLDALLVCDFPANKTILRKLKSFRRTNIFLLLLEPPTVVPHYYNKRYHKFFTRIFTMLDDLVDNKKYLKLHYPLASLTMIEPTLFSQKKLCTLIAGNNKSIESFELYSERRRAIEYWEKQSPQNDSNTFEFYGRGWQHEGFVTYRGSTVAKIATLKNYKFCICYENTKNLNGYITEKIFDAFISGCVPIYLGAPNITDYIPKDCFIAREHFNSYQELDQFLRSMTESAYKHYIENIKRFLASTAAIKFSTSYFITMLIRSFGLSLTPELLFNEQKLKLSNAYKL